MSNSRPQDGVYVIINKKSGCAIDLGGNSVVTGWRRTNGTNQQWTVTMQAGGWRQFVNVGNKSVGLGSNRRVDQEITMIVPSSDPQNWAIQLDPAQDTYLIFDYASGKYATHSDFGSPIALYPITTPIIPDAQKWIFIKVR